MHELMYSKRCEAHCISYSQQQLPMSRNIQTITDWNNVLYRGRCEAVTVQVKLAIAFMSIDEQLLLFIRVNLPQTLWFLTTFMYVIKQGSEVRIQPVIIKTIQSDEGWTLRVPSLQQTGLRNPFLMTCVTIEGKWTRGHVSTAAEQSSHSPTFAPPHCHWHCDIMLSTKSTEWGLEKGWNPV